jgi:hypothetical protein
MAARDPFTMALVLKRWRMLYRRFLISCRISLMDPMLSFRRGWAGITRIPRSSNRRIKGEPEGIITSTAIPCLCNPIASSASGRDGALPVMLLMMRTLICIYTRLTVISILQEHLVSFLLDGRSSTEKEIGDTALIQDNFIKVVIKYVPGSIDIIPKPLLYS